MKKEEIINALKKVNGEVRERFKAEIKGDKDKLIHFYFGIKYEIVMDAILWKH